MHSKEKTSYSKMYSLLQILLFLNDFNYTLAMALHNKSLLRFLAISVFLVSFSHFLLAQSGFIIGINGGMNQSKLRFSEAVNRKTETSNLRGYQAQITVGYQLTNKFTLLSGAQYAQRGTRMADPNQAYKEENGNVFLGSLVGEERTNFLTIPFLMRYKLLSGRFGITLTTGLNLNLGQDGTAFRYVQSNNNSKIYYARYEMIGFGNSINDLYRRNQLSVMTGLGFLIPVSEKGRVVLNANMDWGMLDAYNERFKMANTILEKVFSNATFFNIGYEHHFNMGDKF
jgi:Outer membrane protein beta-barrel domain